MAYGASCSPARFLCYGAAQTIAARLLAYRRCVWGCLARKWLGGSLWTRERTLGLILAVAVHPADLQDRDGALLVLNLQSRRLFPFLETIFADGAYGGAKLRRAMADADWRIEVVNRSAQAKGFEVIPRRWVVERTIAWINRCRRLAKDYENLNRTAIAFIRLASIRLMLRRLTRYCYPS